jgi:gliding motility-associated-like protein
MKLRTLPLTLALAIPAFAGNDSTICKGSSVELGSGQWDDFVYQWVSSTGEEFTGGQPVVRPQTTTTYYLTQTDRWGGVAYDTVHITVYDCDTLYIPNSFTPNGDFINDCFEIVNPGNLLYRIKIWNRWGSLVFEGNESSCWDGSFQSTGLQQGVYMYQISILTPGVMKNRYQGYVVILI